MKPIRGIFISDTHCGDELGLTPPKWIKQSSPLAPFMRDYWSWYVAQLKDIGPVDICIDAGDMVNGNPKGNSRSLVTNDMGDQVLIAIECREMIKAKKRVFCYGTDCHVGGATDWEKMVAYHFGEDIETEVKLDLNGFRISAMHKRGFGKSSSPAGNGGALGKAGVVTYIEEKKIGNDHPHLMVSGHVHDYAGYYNSEYEVMSLPALQIAHRDSTPYARGLVGVYDVGIISFTVDKYGHFIKDKPRIKKFIFRPKGGDVYAKI